MSKNLKHGVPQSRLAFLRKVPIFEGLDDKALALIDSHLHDVDVAEGRVLTSEGSASDEVFIIEEGAAEVRIGDSVIR